MATPRLPTARYITDQGCVSRKASSPNLTGKTFPLEDALRNLQSEAVETISRIGGSKLSGNSDLMRRLWHWKSGNLENNTELGTSGFSAFPAGSRYGAVLGTTSIWVTSVTFGRLLRPVVVKVPGTGT